MNAEKHPELSVRIGVYPRPEELPLSGYANASITSWTAS